MTEQNQDQATPATDAAAPKKEPKPKRAKLTKREDFLVARYNEGVTSMEELGKLLEIEAAAGRLRQNPGVRKTDANLSMWIAQAKWYLHHADKAGKLTPPLVKDRKPRKKKEAAAPAGDPNKPDAGPPNAEQPQAPAAEEQIGTL